MPHIFVDATDTDKNMQSIVLHAEVTLKQSYLHSKKGYAKLEELKDKMIELAKVYFDDCEDDIISDKEFKQRGYNP